MDFQIFGFLCIYVGVLKGLNDILILFTGGFLDTIGGISDAVDGASQVKDGLNKLGVI